MTQWKGVRELFSYTKKQRNGLLLIAALAIAIRLVLLWADYRQRPTEADFSAMEEAIRAWKAEDSIENWQRQSSLFYFDPNTISDQQLRELGLPSTQIATLLKYRERGGSFRKPIDLQKIYGLDTNWYHMVEPYIRIEAKVIANTAFAVPMETKGNSTSTSVKKKLVILELNRADSIHLLDLPGVGPVFAHRILSYRQRLGGFYDKSQLLEVYGLDDQRLALFADRINIDSAAIHKLDLNEASFKQLLRHPYLDYEVVRNIVAFRERVRPFQKVEELRQIELIDDRLFSKIAVYLKVAS